MTSPHQMHNILYRGSKVLVDPGDGGTIIVNQDLQICEMVSTGSGQTRILANPTKAGIRFVMRVLTDGGSIIVTAPRQLNVIGDTEVTMSDAGDLLSLISVTHTTGYRWEILVNTGSVVSSATPSATPSATISHTPSHTISHTKSHTPSHTVSHTPSHTPSHTKSHTPSHTPSST